GRYPELDRGGSGTGHALLGGAKMSRRAVHVRWFSGAALAVLIAGSLLWVPGYGDEDGGAGSGAASADGLPGTDPADAQILEDTEGRLVAANFLPSGEGPSAPTAVAQTLWWEWTAQTDDAVTFDTHGTEFDT